MRNARSMIVLGFVAIAGYGIHAAYHLWQGEPENVLWVCHLASVFVGAGLIAQSGSLAGAGTLLLCLGTPLWIFDLSQGSEFMPTSLFTHGLGLALGLWGVWKLGMAAGAWWKAVSIMIALIAAGRMLTPAASNVNLAFAMPTGMDRYFANHLLYLACMLGISCIYMWIAETILRRVVGAGKPGEVAP